jgi:hypothetical protein
MKTYSSTTSLPFFVVCALTLAAPAQVLKGNGSAVVGDSMPRAITSLSINERMSLPDGTMVKLTSGRVAHLGTLRAEHRARLERFSRAAVLGQAAAAKLSASPRNAAPANSPSASVAQPMSKVTGSSSAKASSSAVTGAIVQLSIGWVPFQMPTSWGTIPKDYSDFCKAAKGTVCIYLPASTTLTAFQGDPATATSWAWDEDPFISDKTVCTFDGGVQLPGGCLFYYPVIHVANFKPTGPLSTTASCDSPSTYYLDPKGAIRASYPYPSPTFTTGGAPITCTVQVWIGK